jgi:hypothetical protein
LLFQWGAELPDPQSPDTFNAAKLAWSWPQGSPQAQLRRLYQDLLIARRHWPALRDRRQTAAHVLNVSASDNENSPLLVLRRGGDGGLLAVANLTAKALPMPTAQCDMARALSTEDAKYGGNRVSLPSPFGRGAGGEGGGGEKCSNSPESPSTAAHRPHPNRLRAPTEGCLAEGTLLPYEMLICSSSGGQA